MTLPLPLLVLALVSSAQTVELLPSSELIKAPIDLPTGTSRMMEGPASKAALQLIFGCRGDRDKATLVTTKAALSGRGLPVDACVSDAPIAKECPACEPETRAQERRRAQAEAKRKRTLATLRKRFPDGPWVRFEVPATEQSPTDKQKLFVYSWPYDLQLDACASAEKRCDDVAPRFLMSRGLELRPTPSVLWIKAADPSVPTVYGAFEGDSAESIRNKVLHLANPGAPLGNVASPHPYLLVLAEPLCTCC